LEKKVHSPADWSLTLLRRNLAFRPNASYRTRPLTRSEVRSSPATAPPSASCWATNSSMRVQMMICSCFQSSDGSFCGYFGYRNQKVWYVSGCHGKRRLHHDLASGADLRVDSRVDTPDLTARYRCFSRDVCEEETMATVKEDIYLDQFFRWCNYRRFSLQLIYILIGQHAFQFTYFSSGSLRCFCWTYQQAMRQLVSSKLPATRLNIC
jgi:hypothetical protein